MFSSSGAVAAPRPLSSNAFCAAVRAALVPLADAPRAEQMSAYLKQHFPFLGIPAPARWLAIRPLLPLLAPTSAESCWPCCSWPNAKPGGIRWMALPEWSATCCGATSNGGRGRCR